MQPVLPSLVIAADMEAVLENSYRDFHVKGFDYICLRRSPAQTVKLYFFDDCDNAETPEVVCPHNHRYDFQTTVIAGEMTDILYWYSSEGAVMNRFAYRTPLNGGDGFEWVCESQLAPVSWTTIPTGLSQTRRRDQIHTIRVQRNTVLCLVQDVDTIPVGEPTALFSFDKEPPKLTGMYNRFTPDQVNRRLKQIGLPPIQ